MNVAILFEWSFSKIIQIVIDSSTEHESLRDRAFLKNLLQLKSKTTILEQLICLIKDNHLDST